MNATEKRIEADRKSSEIVNKKRNSMIEAKCYPSYFNGPVSLQLELTSQCNCKCQHCYNRSGIGHKKDIMTSARWIDFCHRIVSGGGVLQTTISGGEPLILGKELWNIMDILHDDGTVFNMITNGYLFNREVLSNLLKYNFYWVQVSIDSPVSKYHDEFRGLKGSWDKAVTAAYTIALSGIPLRIASTVTPYTINYLEEYVQMAINLGASYFIIGEVVPSGRAFDNLDILLSNEQRNYFYEAMEGLRKKYIKQISILISGSQRVQLEYSSDNVLDGAIIRPDGTVRLDCGCPFVIGNILEKDIFDIWKEKRNCWQHPLVKKYIESCDPITGFSNFMKNYNDNDILI